MSDRFHKAMRYADERTRHLNTLDSPTQEGVKGAVCAGVALFIFYFAMPIAGVEIAGVVAVSVAFAMAYSDGKTMTRRHARANHAAFEQYLRDHPEK